MPRSMTGFGRAIRETPQGEISVEIRAVNSRFNETRVRLPVDAMQLELNLRDRIKRTLARGKIDCTVRLEPKAGEDTQTVNAEAIRRTFEELQAAITGLPLNGGVTLEAVLRAIPRQDNTADMWRDEDFNAEVEAAVEEALTALNHARESEGAGIAQVLEDLVTQVEGAVTETRAVAPEVTVKYEERLRQRIEDLEKSQGVKADNGRLEQELVHFAQRVDVTEELDRLEIHCRAFRDLLASDEPIGRRMDFLVQEIVREINTTGSKARDAGVTGQVVDLKVVAEQMREQIQNLE